MDAIARTLAPVAGFAAALLLLVLTVAISWWLMWKTTIRNLPFVQDMLGNREKKRRMRAEKEAEIQRLKGEHERSRSSMAGASAMLHKRMSVARPM